MRRIKRDGISAIKLEAAQIRNRRRRCCLNFLLMQCAHDLTHEMSHGITKGYNTE